MYFTVNRCLCGQQTRGPDSLEQEAASEAATEGNPVDLRKVRKPGYCAGEITEVDPGSG